jgi:4-phytase/acid phosphatase
VKGTHITVKEKAMKSKKCFFLMTCAFMILISGTAMAQPQAPVLSVTNRGWFYLSWTAVTGVRGYTLSYVPEGSTSIVSVDMGTQTSLSGAIAADAAYYVAVQSRDNTGLSQYSNVVSVAGDNTTLKQIIIFGRHSIRAPTSNPSSLAQYAVDTYPDFTVPTGYLTSRGQQAASLLGSYFHDYLLFEGLLTGDAQTDISRSYFRANSIQRSNVTAAKFGEGLIPGATIPVHSYNIADGATPAVPDPVFDPILTKVATVDTARAVNEVQGIFNSGSAISSAYSGELSLIRSALYPSGTQPTPGALHGSTDPTSQASHPITLTASTSTLYTGGVINIGGLHLTDSAADPFVMQYADNFPLSDVAWGRLSLDAISQQTRINNLIFNIEMLPPYLNQVQSSNAGEHILRTMEQAVTGENVPGAFGDPQTKVHVIISSDGYVIGLAGLLHLHWLLPGYESDFCAPGGALIFELRQVNSTQEYIVRVFYTAQTFDQLRNLTSLTLANPPASMQLLVPGGSTSATNLDVSFSTFQQLMNEAVNLEYVQDPSKETPPGVLTGVPLE